MKLIAYYNYFALPQRDYQDHVDDWRFEQSDWEELAIIRTVLLPFKDATLKLEPSKTPTSHMAGRVMLWLLYKASALHDKPGQVSNIEHSYDTTCKIFINF